MKTLQQEIAEWRALALSSLKPKPQINVIIDWITKKL